MNHTCVCHVWYTCVTWLVDMHFIFGPWLVDTHYSPAICWPCTTSASSVIPSRSVTWRFHICRDSFTCAMTLPCATCLKCDMTHSYATWFIHGWHDSLVATWLVHTWHNSVQCPHIYALRRQAPWHQKGLRHDSVTCDLTPLRVTWLIHLRHDSLIATWPPVWAQTIAARRWRVRVNHIKSWIDLSCESDIVNFTKILMYLSEKCIVTWHEWHDSHTHTLTRTNPTLRVRLCVCARVLCACRVTHDMAQASRVRQEFLQNSPTISGSFAERDLQRKASHASSAPCTGHDSCMTTCTHITWLTHDMTHTWQHAHTWPILCVGLCVGMWCALFVSHVTHLHESRTQILGILSTFAYICTHRPPWLSYVYIAPVCKLHTCPPWWSCAYFCRHVWRDSLYSECMSLCV